MANTKEKIREYDRSVPAKEVADALDTTASYVYKVRSETRREPPADDTPDDVIDSGVNLPNMDETESEPNADESPLSDLVIEDSYDEYECGECGGTVEYLQNNCPNCDTELAWWE